MISNQFAQVKSATNPRDFLAQDYGADFAANIQSVSPVIRNGVTMGYRVRKRRWKQKISINALRRPEVERFACYKYQDAPPAPAEARRLAIVLASIALDHTEAEHQVSRWCVALPEAERADIVDCSWAGGQSTYLDADEIGNLLGVTEAERKGLRIRTFGWAGSTKRSRTLARKVHDKEYRRAKRAREAAELANVAGRVGNDILMDTADRSATFKVRAALQRGACTVADLCEQTGLDHRQVRPALTRLKAKGEAVSVKRGVWALTADAGGLGAAAQSSQRSDAILARKGLQGASVEPSRLTATGERAASDAVKAGTPLEPRSIWRPPAHMAASILAARMGAQRVALGLRALQARGTA